MKRSRKTVFALLLALVMTLGLAATAGATGGDITVDLPDGFIEQTPTDQPMDPLDPVYKIPFTKTVKLGGNVGPGTTDFTIAVCDVGAHDLSYYTDVTYKVVITTNGAGSYDGKLVISGPADKVGDFVSEGFFVREVKNNYSGWTYSDAVWNVMPEYQVNNGVPPMKIYLTKYTEEATAAERMTFENTYTYNTSYTTPDVKPTSSPKTFDAGVALYGVSALLSLTGTALVIKRKNV